MGEAFRDVAPQPSEKSWAEKANETSEMIAKRLDETPPFPGDVLSPESYLRERAAITDLYGEGLITDVDAANRLEQLATTNPTMDTIQNSHVNREVNSQ